MHNSGITSKGFVLAATMICALGMAGFLMGCQSSAERESAFTTALNTYYSNNHECLFANSIKFPLTVNAKDEDQAKELDALVDAGLLNRPGAEKTRHARHEERGAEYELSDMGRLNWTADVTRKDYGNFCIGHPQVNTIESYKKVTDTATTEYDVSYRDSVMLPAWASMPPIEKAFPMVAEDGSGQTDSATLIKDNNGWKVENVSQASGTPVG